MAVQMYEYTSIMDNGSIVLFIIYIGTYKEPVLVFYLILDILVP